MEGRPGDRAAEPVSGPRRAARDRPADHRAWHVPARGRPVVNRALLLEVISGALDAVAHGPGGPVVVVPEGGRAGVGVTTAMIEFTHRHADAYDVVWWISARDPQLVPDQLAQLAEALGVAGPTAAPAEAMRAALAALRGRGGWLVVFDDAESVEDLVGVLPAGPGHVLVGATRPGRVRRRVTVPSFTRAESVRLLQVRHPGLPDDEADVVARRLDDLPVAVDVAGAAADPSAASASGVWAWVFDQLEADDPPAMALLTLLAWLGPDPVPMWLVADDAGPLPTVLAGTAAAERAPTLERRALALVGADGIRVHPVLAAQLVNRTASARPDGASWAVWAVRLLRAAVPADVDDPANRSTWRRLMPHVLTVTDPSRPLDDVTTEVGWLLHHAGEFVTARGAAASARALFEDARELGYRPQERTLES